MFFKKKDEYILQILSSIESCLNNEINRITIEDFNGTINPKVHKKLKTICELIKKKNDKRLMFESKKLDNNNLREGLNTILNSRTQNPSENQIDKLTLDESSNELLSNIDKLNESLNKSVSSIEKRVQGVEEIRNNIKKNIEHKSNLFNVLRGSVIKREFLSNIDAETTAITKAVTVIEEIAFQMNILSLKAREEATAAGESGKGFKVVTEKVEKLASKSKEASLSIKLLVNQINQSD